ncbi:MAG: GT4 family glycosyltransferase PelF [Lachnospiraceae bacterium]|nr:GT4 family glycosyltransferase PelF [Lachnospiraceae bacterium]
MKICMVAEGCYPYVVGGVSSWIHSIIKAFPEHEFLVLAILANRSYRGKFAYELPENLTQVYEVYLEDFDWLSRKTDRKRRKQLNPEEYEAVLSLLINQNVKWDVLFDLFQDGKFSLNEFLMGPEFLRAVRECYQINYPEAVFSDFLWTMRSIYLPLFLALKTEIPRADLYHCVATGYAGVLGSMAKARYGCGLLISEHGIYTREREEELIRAKWVAGIYKNVWIDQFKKMSRLAYAKADCVTSLYEHARKLQIELGCDEELTMVTPNGIDEKRFVGTPGEKVVEENMVHIGAVLRVTPIKDVKTLIRAFAFAKERVSNLKLWIMGPMDEDEQYAAECFEIVETMGIKDIVFTGRVNVTEYLWQMDMTILTSISEGQPLTILESYAAHKPVIATDVGNCRGLIFGEDDGIGPSGILTHVMNVEEITAAMVEMATDEKKRLEYGENGYQRMMKRYKLSDMQGTYRNIYNYFEGLKK